MDLRHLSNQDLEWALGKELLPKYKRMVQAELRKRYFNAFREGKANRYLHLRNLASEGVRKHMNAQKRWLATLEEYKTVVPPIAKMYEKFPRYIDTFIQAHPNVKAISKKQAEANRNRGEAWFIF